MFIIKFINIIIILNNARLTCRKQQRNIPVSQQSPCGGDLRLHHYYGAGGDRTRRQDTTMKRVCVCVLVSAPSSGVAQCMYAVGYEQSFVLLLDKN